MKLQLRAGLLLVVAAFAASVTVADSWAPPETETYLSKDGAWRLTVEPRRIINQLEYFKDKVAEKRNAGGLPGNQQSSAIGFMEHREHGRWHRVWKRPLLNETAPVQAIAFRGGRAATFDNWHSMGHGKDVVALYDESGNLIRAYGLEDFLPPYYVQALPRSVSSIDWRGEPTVSRDGARLVLPVVIPKFESEDQSEVERTTYVSIGFDMHTGKIVLPVGRGWEQALASARKVRQLQRVEEAAARTRFISPLEAPTSYNESDWHRYLVEAFFRVDPDWQGGYPAAHVLRSPKDPGYKQSARWLREALNETDDAGVIMLASPSQAALVAALEPLAKKLETGALSKARIYLALNRTHFTRARSALTHTGATIIQIDPGLSIPQRKQRLERFLAQEAETSGESDSRNGDATR